MCVAGDTRGRDLGDGVLHGGRDALEDERTSLAQAVLVRLARRDAPGQVLLRDAARQIHQVDAPFG